MVQENVKGGLLAVALAVFAGADAPGFVHADVEGARARHGAARAVNHDAQRPERGLADGTGAQRTGERVPQEPHGLRDGVVADDEGTVGREVCARLSGCALFEGERKRVRRLFGNLRDAPRLCQASDCAMQFFRAGGRQINGFYDQHQRFVSGRTPAVSVPSVLLCPPLS